MKKARLIPSQVVLTFGEFALLVSSSPWTIQGCRPISVRTQPAVAAMYGSAIAPSAVQWNQRACSSFFLQYDDALCRSGRNKSVSCGEADDAPSDHCYPH